MSWEDKDAPAVASASVAPPTLPAIGDPNDVTAPAPAPSPAATAHRGGYGTPDAKLGRALAAARKGYSLPGGEGKMIVDHYEAELARLRGVIECDRSAAVVWLDRLRCEVGRWWGMATSRGSYEWDDEQYREEFGRALTRIGQAIDKAEAETQALSRDNCPATQAAVDAARAPLASLFAATATG